MIKPLLLAIAITSIANSFVSAAELVDYRCPQWKAKHVHDAGKAKTITETLDGLGCETKQNQHNGHIDVKYRCEKWMQLSLDSHAEAHKWEKWLKEFGFETKHTH